MGGVSFIQAFRFKMSAGGWFSVLDHQDLVLDKSSKRVHDREHRWNEAGIRRRSPHSALFRPIVAVCPHDEPGGASSPATQSDHAQPLQVKEIVPEGSDRYRRAGQ